MNRDQFEGNCKQLGGTLKQLWGSLAHDPRAVAAGARDRLLGRLQEQRGASKQQADRQLEDFLRRNRRWWDLARRN